ncbi:MAG: hypothetical protein JWM41_2836 [Gemmatimonadetes bacterium]|jgi:hypothetical protein|nr:hypothetical protein [Gemmatimonadota bacterium]
MHDRSLALIAVITLIAASACGMHRTDPGGPADGTVITGEQIDSVHALNALEAVDRLRPVFLVGRGKMSVQPGAQPALPNVYIDNQFYGDASSLRTISAAIIESIKFYSAAEAQFKFGRGNEAGVIGITTKH